MNNILIIGEVVEISGINAKIKVYSTANTSKIMYNGMQIKNISVGCYIKLLKGYTEIIGIVEGEYIKEAEFNNAYMNNNDTFTRILNVKILGHFDRAKRFVKGITETPMISNYAYILEEKEVNSIFTFTNSNEYNIEIGNIVGYENYKLNVSAQKLFANHIGIFGNTGSGKSNTLAKLFTELFSKNFDFSNSIFVFIDFNGEYINTNVLSPNKKVYSLNTRNENDHIPIERETFTDITFWSILFSATEKTQVPFLNRVIESYEYYTINTFNLQSLLRTIHENPSSFLKVKSDFIDLVRNVFQIDKNILDSIFDTIEYFSHGTNNVLRIKNTDTWFDTIDDLKNYLNRKINENGITNFLENKDFTNVDKWIAFSAVLKYKYIYELAKGYSSDEHISPLMKRADKVIREMKKILVLDEEFSEEPIKVIDLSNCNILVKKIVPLLISKQFYDMQKRYDRGTRSLHLIIDEAHNILSESSVRESESWRDYRLEVFEEIVKEGRKFGCFLTIASQRPSDISGTIISQLHNYLIHRLVNDEDLFAIRKHIAFLDSSKHEMIPILTQGQCICSGIFVDFPVNVQVEKLPSEKQPNSNDIKLEDIWTNNQ